MNKKLLIGSIAAVLVLILMCIGILILRVTRTPSVSTTATSTNPFGQNGLQSGTTTSATDVIHIQTTNGEGLTVQNFTTGHPAIAQESGTYYYVTQNPQGEEQNQDFSIVYGTDSSVSIGLLAEPLSTARLHAEAALRHLIPGATNEQLCSLDVSVMTPPSVNDTYAGDQLGLSFCPGATVLP